jgi:hypothetical protein
MMNVAETKDAMIARLLASPLARELQESLSASAAAVRARASEALAQEMPRRARRQAELSDIAQRALSEFERARAAYEKALHIKDRAGDADTSYREQTAQWRSEVRSISSANKARLEAIGLTSVEEFERRYLGLV